MRAIPMVAGLALVVAACGGEKKTDQAAPPAQEQAAPAPAPAAGTVHEVQMDFDGKVGAFVPSALTIKAGDIVKFIVRTGPPHNVAFDPKGIPAGAEAFLNGAMTETMGPLTGPMKVAIGDSYEINFTGAPPGVYNYHCTPHLPFGMKATITVQ
ncbi:MAG TPA: plastocyanin/azurin family copper-binding protein [Gemmatimonadales bacterium]|nr:plastocyanin/azurin family copper-binding protein [Gemmatimonadales bacterium]